MADCIDPGPGWRLLKPEEIIEFGDERRLFGKWVESLNAGMEQVCGFAYRRRISAPHTTKAIATRATVRSVFAGGIVTESTIRSDVGLSLGQMEKATEAYEKQLSDLRNKFAIPEYIMFEIQRGPNDC